MDGTSELFAPFVAALPKDFEPISIHYPADRFLSYAQLEILLQSACPASESFFLIAESFSCPLAIQYAAEKPQMLKALILCSGFSTSPIRHWRWVISLFAPIAFRIRIPKFAIRRWLIGSDSPVSLASMAQAAISSVAPDVLCRRLQAVIACDVRAAASQIAVPVLYIRANQDRLVRINSVEELQLITPRFSVAVLDGPHLILQSKPQQAIKEVVQFLRSSGDN